MNKRLILIIALLGFAGGIVASRLLVPDPALVVEPATATWIKTPRPVPEFELLDHHGQVFDKTRLTGDWSWLFFGFTHCPDVCPTTLSDLDVVARQLAEREDLEPMKVVFVSVDPERDTIERLAAYVPHFNSAFVGVTGSAAQIGQLTANLGVAHQRVALSETDDPDDYTFDHTAAVFLINPQGNLAGVFSSPHVPAQMVEDFLIISGQT